MKLFKLLPVLLLIIVIFIIFITVSPYFTPQKNISGFNGTNTSLIICYSTGDMKGLEVGVASYAGNEGMPLILTSNSIPYPLNDWLIQIIEQAHIQKVIVVGPVSQWQINSLKQNNIEVESISGTTKAEILSELAEKNYKTLDTVIITSSDPSASLLGAYMDVPVLVVADPGKYTSSDVLAPEYENLLDEYNVKKVIIVGSVSDDIKMKIEEKKIQIDYLKGDDNYKTSQLVSDRIIDLLRQRGVVVKTAYCGFYGELPSIVPLAVKNNSIMLIDPTLHMDDAVNYLKTNDITQAVITRNGPADYLQMEEPDFVSKTFTNMLNSSGINTISITNFRTINEATGLFETKMMAAEELLAIGPNKIYKNEIYTNLLTIDQIFAIKETQYPPYLDIILKGGNWETSTGSKLTILQLGPNQWYFGWKGIHPYIWNRINNDEWYCYSGSQYSWHWTHVNKSENQSNQNKLKDVWTVEYLSNDKVYTKVYWVKKGELWEEIHTEATFIWQYEGKWICSQSKNGGEFLIYPNPFYNNLFN